jgi:Ca2+-binding RTX toxin-like protein
VLEIMADTLTVIASGDSWEGAPRFELFIDGALAGSFAVSAAHGVGAAQELTVTGDFGPGPHRVELAFVNDAWGGTPATDRNLYVDAIVFNGQRYEAEAASNDADPGGAGTDPNAAAMFTNGRLVFTGVAGGAPGLVGTPGNDTLPGGPGDDTIEALGGNDVLIGGPGRNVLDGGAGLDIAIYADSPSAVTATLGAPEGTAEAGDHILDRLIGIEALRGSAFDDVLTGDDAANLLEGGAGNDRILGGGGNDLLLSGQRGSNEIVVSGFGVGSGGTLFPELRDGDDFLDGGPGDDMLIGGAATTYFIRAGHGNDTIFNFVPGGTVQLDGYKIGDLATLFANVTPGAGSATIDLGNGERLSFAAGPHPGVIDPRSMDIDFVFTNVAAPTEDGPTPTPDVPRGYVAPDASGVAQGTAAAESIFATGAGQTLIGGGGDDVFHVGSHAGIAIDASGPGVSTVSTWSGAWTLEDGVDNLTANGDYAHALTGNSGDNVLTGAGGSDRLDGGLGEDLLVGGDGGDLFVYRGLVTGIDNGDDVIADFSRAEGDRIALDLSFLQIGTIENFSQLEFQIGRGLVDVTTTADSLTLAFSPQDSLTIRGITDLREQDWIFPTA